MPVPIAVLVLLMFTAPVAVSAFPIVIVEPVNVTAASEIVDVVPIVPPVFIVTVLGVAANVNAEPPIVIVG